MQTILTKLAYICMTVNEHAFIITSIVVEFSIPLSHQLNKLLPLPLFKMHGLNDRAAKQVNPAFTCALYFSPQ